MNQSSNIVYDITLGLALHNNTWVERRVEVKNDPNFWTNGELDYANLEKAAYKLIPEDEMVNLDVTFYKIIYCESKD